MFARSLPRAWNFRIDFIGRMQPILWLSAVASLLSIVAIYVYGLNLGTDFTGGYEIQVAFPVAVSESQIRDMLTPLDLEAAKVQRFGEAKENNYLILVHQNADATTQEKDLSHAQYKFGPLADRIDAALKKGLSLAVSEDLIKRVDFVGPLVGAQLRNQGLLAVFYSLLMILLYVAVRFDLYFSPGAIIATLHDVLITMGIFALFQIEFNLTVVAAVLTLIGYSLNDTIVVYDRIRENVAKYPTRMLHELVNNSINETLSRTILTSGTVFFVVVSLLVLGGPSIRGFSMTMFIGVIVGTYSSIAVASPLYILFRQSSWLRRGAAKKKTVAIS